jgi:hypothetical protein
VQLTAGERGTIHCKSSGFMAAAEGVNNSRAVWFTMIAKGTIYSTSVTI